MERDFSFPLEAPGSLELPDGSSRITLQLQEKSADLKPYVTLVNELDWDRLPKCNGSVSGLELRNWRPGDQYRRVGESAAEKIKLLFQEARVPLWERRNWPIITYNGIILWARRFGAAADYAAGPSSRAVLRIDESSWGSSHRSVGF